jgi:hypothetical protein
VCIGDAYMRVPEPRGQVRGRWSPQHLASLSCPFSPGCRTTIWTHRVHFLEEQALPRWASFTIWNAGKQGRRLYRSLTAASQHKVSLSPPHSLHPPCLYPAAQTQSLKLLVCAYPRWLPSVMWMRTKSGRASTAMRTLRYVGHLPGRGDLPQNSHLGPTSRCIPQVSRALGHPYLIPWGDTPVCCPGS